jgi:hypothetical protein
MRVKIVLALVVAVAVAAGAEIMRACGESDSSGVKGTPVERLINPEGWTIPGLPGSHPVGHKTAIPGSPGVKVYSTELRPGKSNAPIRLTDYETPAEGGVLIARPRHDIQLNLGIVRYEANGHIFAYVVGTETAAECVLLPKKGQRCSGVSLGDITRLIYYDNDGDGRFETFEVSYGSAVVIPPGLAGKDLDQYVWEHRYVKVPAWVKQNAVASK